VNPVEGSEANPRAVSARIKSRAGKGAANQRAHDLRIGRQPSYVDGTRSHLNRHLIQHLTASQLRKVCDGRRDQFGPIRKRTVSKNVAVGTTGIITFGREAQKFLADMPELRQDEMYLEVAERISQLLDTSLTGLTVHVDETAPHAHFQMPATTFNGKPVSKLAVKSVLNQLQDIVAEVCKTYDPRFERGNRRLDREAAGAKRSETINRSVRKLHDDLPREIGALKAQLLEQQKRYDDNQRRIAANNKKSARFALTCEEKAAKAQRTAKAYERRSADALSKVATLQAEVQHLEQLMAAAQNAEARLDQATKAADDAEARLQPLRDAVGALEEHEASIDPMPSAKPDEDDERAAAAIMFSKKYVGATAIAVLQSGDSARHQDDDFGGYDLAALLERHGAANVSERGDLRKVRDSIYALRKSSWTDLIGAMKSDERLYECYFWICDGISKIGHAVRNAGGQWRDEFWGRVSRDVASVLKQSFDRLAKALAGENATEQARSKYPVEAAPLATLPTDAQEKVRMALRSTGPRRG